MATGVFHHQVEAEGPLGLLGNVKSGQAPLDEAILEALPQGTQVQSVCSHGRSPWSLTAKINATGSDGSASPFLLKCVSGDLGESQLQGEFTGMSELRRVAPDLVPNPVAWGKLRKSALPTHLFLIEFKHLVTGLPDPVRLGARLGAMHRKSAVPGGKFGFHVQTYDGARVQAVGWDRSWSSFFSELLAEAYRQDSEANGSWPELDILFRRVQSHLIPRLIGVLESEGRHVTPVLIHGDLWDGNVASDSMTGDPWIFDCAAYYAHNEMELGIWRAERHQLRAEVFREEYLKHFGPSEPMEEFDDRNRLYSAKTNFMHSACFSGSPARRLAFTDMFELVQKYVPWDESCTELHEVRVATKDIRA